MIGAVILLVSVSQNEQLKKFLSGDVGVFLGWISFPLYLIHVVIICSLSSAKFLGAFSLVPSPYSNAIAALVTIVGSILAAVPLAAINDRLLLVINRWTKGLTLSRVPNYIGA